jgi:hypothetical protein
MVFEYVHRISLYEIGSYVRHYLDEHGTIPMNGRPMNYLLEMHLNLLLCNDLSYLDAMRRKLHQYLSPHHADTLTDLVHDMLLYDTRHYLTLDEGETVIEVSVKSNYDAVVVVHERDGAHALND